MDAADLFVGNGTFGLGGENEEAAGEEKDGAQHVMECRVSQAGDYT